MKKKVNTDIQSSQTAIIWGAFSYSNTNNQILQPVRRRNWPKAWNE